MSSDELRNVGNLQKLKRKRGPIFTIEDKNILVDIVEKYYHIIENKKTDNQTVNSKNYCWETQISTEYNSGASCPRSTAVLKTCWKNLKAEERKVAANERQARIKTGGGLKEYVAVDTIIFRVIDLIRPTAVGLINPHDTDSVLGNTMSQNEDNFIPEIEKNEDNFIPEIEVLGDTQVNVQGGSNLNGDWSQYTPGQMRMPRTTILRKLPQSSVDVDEDGSFVLNIDGFLSAEDKENKVITTPYTSSTTKEIHPSISVAEPDLQTFKRPAITPLTAQEIAPKKCKPNKKHSSRHQLNRRRPVISQEKNEELVSKRVEALTTVTSHAEEEHQIVMKIHHEKLKQERIRTRVLLLELKKKKNVSKLK
ncbi:uncharacterized protein LOC123678577 isoform X2 [Harmonia axyridis]|uniref:uncharacterized protein LOC123678577 isoform X2 n=1 Tax=Harmonia axyridis TaxID=115357 RepID=UPI001E276162|nr:uncharacterized protein LOC123678577 isoform X2 [Harmonia axyridis]